MTREVVKLRSANGSFFVTIPKRIVAEIPSGVTHLKVFLDAGKISFEPLGESL